MPLTPVTYALVWDSLLASTFSGYTRENGARCCSCWRKLEALILNSITQWFSRQILQSISKSRLKIALSVWPRDFIHKNNCLKIVIVAPQFLVAKIIHFNHFNLVTKQSWKCFQSLTAFTNSNNDVQKVLHDVIKTIMAKWK